MPKPPEFVNRDEPDLSILIVCYRSLSYIGDALEGVFTHTSGCSFEVLLTDCSDDGTLEWIAKNYPKVKCIPTDQNLGFAAGNNFLAKHARGRRLLLLNPDVIVEDNAIGELFRCSKDFPDAGAWGGVTRLPSGAVDPGCRQSTPTLKRLALAAIGQEKRTIGGLVEDAAEPDEVEGLSGAFMMLDRETWNQFGGFDTEFFMYAEELDLCYRLRMSGRPLIMTPRARIIHLVGGGDAINARRATAIAKAKMHFLRKHRGNVYATAAGMLYWIASFNRGALGSVISRLKTDQRAEKMQGAFWPVAARPDRWWTGYPRNQTDNVANQRARS